MISKLKEKFMSKQRKEVMKHKKPTLQEKLDALVKKHGDISKVTFVDGYMHYFFYDETEIYFKQGFAGIEIIYVKKGFMYDIHNY